jgi:hypothetical protein
MSKIARRGAGFKTLQAQLLAQASAIVHQTPEIRHLCGVIGRFGWHPTFCQLGLLHERLMRHKLESRRDLRLSAQTTSGFRTSPV